jgi:hypothetical protein
MVARIRDRWGIERAMQHGLWSAVVGSANVGE